MSEHFIGEIEIKNYKLFKDFKAEGFGRVNLIGGKNNVGKTAFMEACYLNLNAKKTWFLSAFQELVVSRDNFYWANFFKNILLSFKHLYLPFRQYAKFFRLNTVYSINSNINKIQFEFQQSFWFLLVLKFKLNNSQYFKYIDFIFNVKFKNSETAFLYNIGVSERRLEYLYKKVNDWEQFNKNLTLFDKSLKSFKMTKKEEFFLTTIDDREIHLREFGDGIKQFINFLLIFHSNFVKYIFIDEIENGIHYTNLDKLWEIILTVSKEQSVQVFATTHSKECIESYARVAKRLGDEEIMMMTLARNLNNELKALVWNQKQFFSEMEQNHEVRGW